MHHFPILAVLLIVLGSCGSPPKPPTVDEGRKRSVNAPTAAIELQVLQGRIFRTPAYSLSETTRLAERANAACHRDTARVAVSRRSSRHVPTDPKSPWPTRSTRWLFGFASAQVVGACFGRGRSR